VFAKLFIVETRSLVEKKSGLRFYGYATNTKKKKKFVFRFIRALYRFMEDREERGAAEQVSSFRLNSFGQPLGF
jgi:hypothetical protein